MKQQFSWILITEDLWRLLTGSAFLESRLLELWNIDEDDEGRYLQFTSDGRKCACLDEACALSDRVKEFGERLLLDGSSVRRAMYLESDGELWAEETKLKPGRALKDQRGGNRWLPDEHDMLCAPSNSKVLRTSESIARSAIADVHGECELRHGIRLRITSGLGRMTATAIDNFLAEAVNHFKRLRANAPGSLVGDRKFRGDGRDGKDTLGKIELSYVGDPGQETQSIERWTESVIDGYCCVNSVKQLIEQLPQLQQRVDDEKHWLCHPVKLLDLPAGEWRAVKEQISRRAVSQG